MKKNKIGSIELLGYIGIAIWVAVVLLRGYPLLDNSIYLFLLGTLPNLAAAWVMTMFIKWGIVIVFKKNFTIKIHFSLCIGIVVLAFISEIIHDFFFNSPFDIYDMILTVFAQAFMFALPVLTKELSFSNSF